MEIIAGTKSISKTDKSSIKLKLIIAKIQNISFWGKSIVNLAAYVLLLDLAFIFLYPFIYMVITSLKSPLDVLDITVKWIPRSFYYKNYMIALESLDYLPKFLRSSFVTLACTIGHILSCSMIAYGFARYKLPLKNAMFNLVILTIIIPVQVLIFSQLVIYSRVGMLNTYIPLILPTFFGFGLRGGLFIFIFRQFFAGLPYELEEAARMDGCGAFKTYWRIILPVAGSALLVCTILSLVWHWNEYFESSMFLSRPAIQLLPSGLSQLYSLITSMENQDTMGAEISREGITMAATFTVVMPILVVYLFLQKKFMQSIERSGLVG